MELAQTPFLVHSLIFAGQDFQNQYILTLKEEDSKRAIQMLIGFLDAQPLALELEKLKKDRPLTHDLFKTVLDTHQIKVESVEITSATEKGKFFSEIKFTTGKKIDARPSDAIILAIKAKAPIFISEMVMSDYSIELEHEGIPISQEDETTSEKDTQPEQKQLYASEKDKYTSLLNTAIAEEDYEAAAKYRDAINRMEETN